jgi:hypothetical protein
MTVSGISNILLNCLKTPFLLSGSRSVHHGCAWWILRDVDGKGCGLFSVTFTAYPWVK